MDPENMDQSVVSEGIASDINEATTSEILPENGDVVDVEQTSGEGGYNLELVEIVDVRGGNGASTINVAEAISEVRAEIGLPPETKSAIEIKADKFREVVSFLGVDTALFGAVREYQVLPDIDDEKLELTNTLVEQAQKQHELREELRKYSEIFDMSVNGMRDLIDTTSSWTEDHSTRLTVLGYQLMEKMWGFDPSFKKSFYQAGLLHDAGKIAVPKRILDKDGRLTPEERKIINTHTEAGDVLMSNLVRHNPLITDGTKHHEKWGGGGYSYGLKGSEIPFISQVLGPTDVFDALVSERPYKQGFTFERAMKIIREMSEPQEIVDRDTGEPVLDPKTDQPIVNTEHFSKLPVAYLETMWLNRKLKSGDYFAPEEAEKKIVAELEGASLYSKEKNERAKDDNREKLSTLMSETFSRSKLISPEDIKIYINRADDGELAGMVSNQEKEIDRLSEAKDKFQEVYVDALFVMVKSIDARYQAYREGSDVDELAGGQTRTENVIRYSLMLAQQMDLSLEEQKQVAMAAMFADFGILGIDEEKVRSDQTLGVTSYEEFKNVPIKGYELLGQFTSNREIAPDFRGAEIGAAEAHLWTNDKGGYGMRISENESERQIGEIVAITSRYVALRADNLYRGKGFDQNQAMDIMREGVGKEFNEEIWNRWEALYARDTLRVFKERPRVVGEVKELFKGKEVPIVRASAKGDMLVDFSQKILNAENDNKKIKVCFEAARYAGSKGAYTSMERFLELAEPVAIKQNRGDEIVALMAELYNYDLEKSRKQGLVAMRERTKSGEAIKAIGVVEGMIVDFAEKGKSIPEDLAEVIREEITVAYKIFVEKVLESYREHAQSLDKDVLEKDEQILMTGLEVIGDDKFSQKIQSEIIAIKQEGMKTEIYEYITSIREFTEDSPDPFNGEHLVAKANKIFEELTPQNQKGLIVEFKEARNAFYRRGYSIAFEQLRKEADEGNVHIVIELKKRIGRWLEDAKEKGTISEAQFDVELKKAYANGIDNMDVLLQVEDLGLEDIPLVGAWVANIHEWQEELGGQFADRKTQDELNDMREQALNTIRQNLPKEIDRVVAEGDLASLKRLAIMVGDYVLANKDSRILRSHELDGKMIVVRNEIFDIFVDDLKKMAKIGEAEEVSLAIGYFYKFCGGGGRNEIIGLTDVQRGALEVIKKESFVESIKVRIHHIQKFGADARISQLERELKRLDENQMELERIDGGAVDKDVIKEQITQAIYDSFESKLAVAVGFGDVVSVSFTLDKLFKLVELGFINEDKDKVVAIRKMTAPIVEMSVNEVVEMGKLDKFRALENIFGLLGEKDVLKKLQDGKVECYKQHAERVAIRLRVHGIKSEIVSMRELEDELLDMEEIVPNIVDPEIFKKSQQEAERVIRLYEVGDESCELLQGVAINARKYALRYMKEATKKLFMTRSGAEDAVIFERMSDRVNRLLHQN